MRNRPERIGSGVAAAVMAGALVAGCGGGEPLSRAEFTDRVNAACEVLRRDSDDVRAGQEPGATGETVRRYLEANAANLRDLIDRVDDLDAPSVVSQDFERLVELLDQYAEGLEDLATRVRADQGLRNVFEAHPSKVAELNAIAAEATDLVAGLGFSECILTA
jgi:hypothetical protein